MAGNFLADFLSKKDHDKLDPNLKAGVEMHQWIDSFTDSHENISLFNKFFHPVIHHYAPVATDIVMDYFLYKNWLKYIDITYAEFSKKSYDALLQHDFLFPDKPRNIAYRMIQGQWLRQYTSLIGLEEVLLRMNQRASFEVDFKLCIPILLQNEQAMNDLFVDFFNEAQTHAASWISLRNEEKK